MRWTLFSIRRSGDRLFLTATLTANSRDKRDK